MSDKEKFQALKEKAVRRNEKEGLKEESKVDKAVDQMKKEQEKFNEMLHEGIVEQPSINVVKSEIEPVVQIANDGQDIEKE